jgi:adenylyltransferase/sulfurtransferase
MIDSKYSRQELFYGIGKEGQQLIRKKHAVIIGAGALGSAAAETLVRAGIGKITVIDRDFVEPSNLHRQQLFTENDAANSMPKAEAARKRLEAVNSDTVIHAIVGEVNPAVMSDMLPADLVIDALDNFDTRMFINDFCAKHNIPWIHGAVVSSYGLSFTVLPGKTPCLHCLLESVPLGTETCDTVGVISPVVQMVSAHQTTEALKILTGNTDALRETLISFDLWKNETSSINVSQLKNADCPSCGEQAAYPYLKDENRAKSIELCGRDAVMIRPGKKQSMSFSELKSRYTEQIKQANEHLIVLMLEDKRFVIFQDGRTIIHGEQDKKKAHLLYNKYIGG